MAATQVIGPQPQPMSRITASVDVSGGASRSRSLVPTSSLSAEKTPRSEVSMSDMSGKFTSINEGELATVGSSSK